MSGVKHTRERETHEQRLERYRRHNAKRKLDPAYMEAKRKRDRERHYRLRESEEYRQIKRETSQRMREKHPEKEAARRATRSAIERGDLVRQPCEVCGKTRVDAHHDDYSKPLEVRWLCRTHHVEHHARARGEQDGGGE